MTINVNVNLKGNDWVDLSKIPTFFGNTWEEKINKFLAYKKAGIMVVDSTTESSVHEDTKVDN